MTVSHRQGFATMLAAMLHVTVLVATTPRATAQICYSETATLVGEPLSSSTGRTVAMRGTTALVGATLEGDHGAVYIFERDESGWSQQAHLTPSLPAGFGSEFGHSLAVDGDVVVIGAWLGNWNPYGPLGAAYVYRRSGTSWTFEQELGSNQLAEFSYFGASVAVSQDTLVVCADGPELAFVFVWDGTAWIERAQIDNPGPNGGYFGNQVALSAAPSSSTLVVGAPFLDLPGNTSNGGGAYVFVGNGASWTLQAEILPPGSPLADRHFGAGLALSGDTLLIGAPDDRNGGVRTGSAFVFTRNSNAWSFQKKLVSPVGAEGDDFGFGVALDQNQAVVSAPHQDGPGFEDGAAYTFYRSGSSWSAAATVQLDEAPGSSAQTGFGVAISNDRIVMGTPPTARVFDLKTRVGTAYCHCASAPCANADVTAGCANSTGVGAILSAQGGSVDGDIDLLASRAVPNVFGLFFQGDVASQVAFGDGQLCANQNIIRLSASPILVSASGSALFGPCNGGPTVPEVTGVVPGSGLTKRYQFWYRDPSGPCGSGFNTTNGVAITW